MKNDSIKNRYEFIALVQSVNCNPNGDPDMGNLPRQDPDTEFGYITDVAVKRRIRNYVDDAFIGRPYMDILAKNGVSINRKIAESVFAVNGIDKIEANNWENKKVKESTEDMLKKYWDLRAFGGVLSTGLNAGQIRGAVQIGIASSVDPIQPENISITRMYYADGKDFKTLNEYAQEEGSRPSDKKRTMGNKAFIPYGLYVVKGTISANLAEKTHFTEADLDALFEAILQMYNHDVSSSKAGMSVIAPLIIFKHIGTQTVDNIEQNEREAKLGCAPAYRLFDLLHIRKKDGVTYPRNISDYNIQLALSELPKGVALGLKMAPFEEVIWDTAVGSRYEVLDLT